MVIISLVYSSILLFMVIPCRDPQFLHPFYMALIKHVSRDYILYAFYPSMKETQLYEPTSLFSHSKSYPTFKILDCLICKCECRMKIARLLLELVSFLHEASYIMTKALDLFTFPTRELEN